MRDVLELAKEKLECFYKAAQKAQGGGMVDYVGGMEYGELMKLIKKALVDEQ